MRVLHFIDAGNAAQREFNPASYDGGFDDRVLSCGLMSTCGEAEQSVCIIGPGGAAERARRLGLGIEYHICPLLRMARLASQEVGRLVRRVRPDFVHWWGAGMSGGCFGRPGRAWRFESWAGLTPLGLPLWLTDACAIACSPGEAEGARRVGFPRIVRVDSPVFVPGHRGPRADAPRLLLLCARGDVRKFAFIYGVLGLQKRPVISLISPHVINRARANLYRRKLHFVDPVEGAAEHRAGLLALADVALWMSEEPSPIAIRSALAAGVPVVAPPRAADLIPDVLKDACLAFNDGNAELSRKLVTLVEDPEFRASVSARAAAAFDPGLINGTFVDSVLNAWRGEAAGVTMKEAV